IKRRVQETDTAAPVPYDEWFYVTSTIEGQSYPVHRRGPAAATASAQVVLDQNAEAAGHEFFDLGCFEVSPDHRFVAWSGDVHGEWHDTAWAGVAWSTDGEYLFYVVADAQERPFRVMRHRMGTPQAGDVEVFVDNDERFYVGIGTTRNQRATVIHSGCKLSS